VIAQCLTTSTLGETVSAIVNIFHGSCQRFQRAHKVFWRRNWKLAEDFVELVSEMLPEIDFDMHQQWAYSIAQGVIINEERRSAESKAQGES